MSNNNGQSRKQRFIELLHELFQLNQPELDFGLYRIMHAKSGQLKEFIENDLAREIDDAFAEASADAAESVLEQARAEAIEALGENAFDADGELKLEFHQTPKGKKYLEALKAVGSADVPLAGSAEIYDHLYRFFSRYYDKGDFLSKRYHVAENESRAAPYAVPYDGREVYLHWANKDQYYIKSSEYLQHFTFDLVEAVRKEQERQGNKDLSLGSMGEEDFRVTFQLVDASEGAHNNVKDNQPRFFIIHTQQLVEISDGELRINFEYRQDPEKSGQEATWQKTRLEQAEKAIIEALKQDKKGKPWLDGLSVPAPTEKQSERTLLGKYLTRYTARNTMDYFIHKDLGGFLRRELDFYIKNEIMRLDDVENADAPGVEEWLGKVRALRRIARQIIAFLAQLEDFQKKLWLKKKFVTETNYCITLDRVPETLYEEIVEKAEIKIVCPDGESRNQREEWVKLFAIDEIEADTTTPAYSEPLTVDFLKANDKLALDTQFFGEDFKDRLLASIENLDELCGGLLIHSDNYQAINLISEKYNSCIKSIYLDPPYNTDASSILYKNDYKDSSWYALMQDRISLGKELLNNDGIMCLAIDDEEVNGIRIITENIFEKKLGIVAVRSNPAGRKTKGKFAPAHEYALFYGKTINSIPASLMLTEKRLQRYPNQDSKGRFAWANFIRSGSNDKRQDRPKLFYPIFVTSDDRIRIPDMKWNDAKQEYDLLEDPAESEEVVYPIRYIAGKKVEKNWQRGHSRVRYELDEYRVRRKDGEISIDFKTRIDENSLPTTWWDNKEYASSNYGAYEIKQLFGSNDFDFPKALNLVKDCLRVSGLSNTSTCLDYFSGSGTTAHAVIDFNREDGGTRKYIVVEMGHYFDSILKLRALKAIYSKEWKVGRPISNDGISHCFKYLRLESYEDTLNNLMLSSDEAREKVLSGETNTELRRDYYLNYFLDVETQDSASLLNVREFYDPTAYTLMVKKPGADSRMQTQVDLVETFNWLIGMEVAQLDRPRRFTASFEREQDPELPEDQHTRLRVKGRLKESDQGDYWLRTVEGYVRRTSESDSAKDKVLVVWRRLTEDPERDAAVLETFLEKKAVNQADSEFDIIYINGPHALTLPGEAKTRVLSLEETFHARMWAEADMAVN